MTAPDPSAFEVRRATVREGVELAYVRAGEGGAPLLLVHGWPETKRIWWRNIGPLAEAGFEVIVPDLRGFGDTDASVEKAQELGATLTVPPMDIPNVGRFAVITDPNGTPFSIIKNAPQPQPE